MQAGATDAAPLHHLIRGYFLHHLKLAKAAACAFRKLPALTMQNADDVDAAQLVERRSIGKAFFKLQSGAALGQGVAIGFAPCHAEIDSAAIDDFR